MSGKNLGGGYAARHTLGNIRKKALSGDVQDSQIAYYLGCRDPCCGESKDRWVAGAACPFTTIDERETAKEEKSKDGGGHHRKPEPISDPQPVVCDSASGGIGRRTGIGA